MSSTNYQSVSNSTQRRLGEYLQTAGLLNSEQLDEAIEYQCIYGGKLGTSLIELGLIEENQLAKILSEQLGHHYIKPELLMTVPSSLLKLIPRKTALKYQVIPYHKDGKRLYVAMNEPKNLTLIDELSFQLDHIIIPLAIPEIRLILALQKHYNMMPPPRYETLAGQINRRNLAAERISSKKNSNKDKQQKLPVIEPETETPAADVSTWPLLGGTPFAAAEEEEDQDSYFYDQPAQKEVKNRTSLFQKLANAQDRDDIARAIIAHLKTDFPKCALMMVRKETVNGWLATVEKGKQPFEQIVISLQEQSVFNLVTTNHAHYLGPMIDSPQTHAILDFFATQLPQDVLIMPLTVQNKLVCILYIQGDYADLEQHLTEFRNIADKVELSFKLLILKNKILTL
ncbi:MAG: hypothetical protein PF441_01440 [Desulfuromusa sp.]|nr:hypothetical protein [Desulfuromusa sp.]